MLTVVATKPARGLLLVGLAVAAFLAGVFTAAVGAVTAPVIVPLFAFAGAALAVSLRRPWAPLMLVVTALPIGQRPVGPAEVIELTIVLAIALMAVSQLNGSRSPVGWATGMGWLAVIVGLALVALPSAVDPSKGVRLVVQLCVGLLFVAGVVAVCSHTSDVRRILMTLVVVGGTACTFALASASQLRVQAGGAIVANRATGFFNQPNQLGGFAAFVFVVALTFAAASRRGSLRLAGALASIGALVALALSLSRGAWIGAVVGAVTVGLLLKEVRRRALVLGVPLVVLAIAFGALRPGGTEVQAVQERVATLASGTSPYETRPLIWREAIRQIADDPFTGQGPASFPAASAKTRSEARIGADHAHNILLTVAAELGVPASIAVLGFAGAMLVRAIKAIRRQRGDDRVTVVALTGGLAALAGQGTVDFVFRNPVLFVLLWLSFGLLLACTRSAT